MIVLDEDAIGEIEPVILAAPAPYRILIQRSEAGDGLSGIEDRAASTGHRIDVLPRRGGDAAHSLEHIQDDALAAQHDARVMTYHGDLLSGANTDAIKDLAMGHYFRMSTDGTVEHGKDFKDALNRAGLPINEANEPSASTMMVWTATKEHPIHATI